MSLTREELEEAGATEPRTEDDSSEELRRFEDARRECGVGVVTHPSDVEAKLTQAGRGLLSISERNRDVLFQDEREYGIAFVNVIGERVDPNCVFKSVANSYTDSQGRAVTLWKSESA